MNYIIRANERTITPIYKSLLSEFPVKYYHPRLDRGIQIAITWLYTETDSISIEYRRIK